MICKMPILSFPSPPLDLFFSSGRWGAMPGLESSTQSAVVASSELCYFRAVGVNYSLLIGAWLPLLARS